MQSNSYSAKSIRDKIIKEQMSKLNKNPKAEIIGSKIQEPRQENYAKHRVFSFSDKQAEEQKDDDINSLHESNSSWFNTNKQSQLMREIGYLDLVVKATELDSNYTLLSI